VLGLQCSDDERKASKGKQLGTSATVLCSRCAVARIVRALVQLVVAALLLTTFGCVVPQPRGDGTLTRVAEPTTKRGYWLYLPKDYVAANEAGREARRWPLVVTFHGMKPFDTSHAQALEWEQEADRYGFIVTAPDLAAPDLLQQFPVRAVSAAFKSDEECTLAMLEHVFVTTRADPGNVLATSWSSGGYMAHYMLNQHPNRFTCLAVRQSNFSASILDSARVAQSRRRPVLILNTQNDFPVVKHECKEAIQWYEAHEYTQFAWVEIKDLGHERTPDTAAAFFARFAEVEPNRPPVVLARRQAMAGNARGRALLAGAAERVEPGPVVASAPPPPSLSPGPTRARPTAPAAPAKPGDGPLTVRSPAQAVAAEHTSPPAIPPSPPPARALPRSPVAIRVSSAIGTEPLVLAFSADCPADWLRGADFLWTLNGDPICSGVNGQKTITQPGEHTLGLLVVTTDGEEHRAYRLIRVLPHIEAARRPD
jgi:poly(3-hydroxybutyrate) depolymerase